MNREQRREENRRLWRETQTERFKMLAKAREEVRQERMNVEVIDKAQQRAQDTERREREQREIFERLANPTIVSALQSASEIDEVTGNTAERLFASMAIGYGKEVLKNGWPDFAVVDGPGKKPYCVEVKDKKDLLSEEQVRCFSMLELAGVDVYVWMPAKPRAFIKWREWHKSKNFRLRGSAKP